TAQGRSMPWSLRLPTGSSSLEKARGWIRLPRPAAGTIPHMSGLLDDAIRSAASGALLQKHNQLLRPFLRTVFGERALARAPGHALEIVIVQRQGSERILRAIGKKDLF